MNEREKERRIWEMVERERERGKEITEIDSERDKEKEMVKKGEGWRKGER
jgi:hypothetical protein